MALSWHADYRWICVTSLEVNEIDFEWERIKNHILGVWNSSDISLDLGKLHNQIQTLEHFRLDFTTTGEANDFFHIFSNFISGKTILFTVSSYVALGAIILLLIIILPCIVRILRQSIRNLATELHLVVLKNKKGGDAGSQHEESHPWQGHVAEAWWARRVKLRFPPWYFLSMYPPNRNLPALLYCTFPLFWHTLEKVSSGL